MFKCKMTLPRTLLTLFLSLNLAFYLIKNFSEINTLKLVLSFMLIGMMTYGSFSYIIQLFNKKNI